MMYYLYKNLLDNFLKIKEAKLWCRIHQNNFASGGNQGLLDEKKHCIISHLFHYYYYHHHNNHILLHWSLSWKNQEFCFM